MEGLSACSGFGARDTVQCKRRADLFGGAGNDDTDHNKQAKPVTTAPQTQARELKCLPIVLTSLGPIRHDDAQSNHPAYFFGGLFVALRFCSVQPVQASCKACQK